MTSFTAGTELGQWSVIERGEKKRRKMKEQAVASETGRKEKLLNDETICAVKLLDQTSTNRRTSSMATGSVTKREATISLNTPIIFSSFLSLDPPPFPNYKTWCIHRWVNTNKNANRQMHKTQSSLMVY